MGLFDRFRGAGVQRPIGDAGDMADDQRAIERYRYMLRTAPPETIEQAHADAFARLTPEQRRRVLDELAGEIPEAERAGVARGDNPEQLARVATRAEIRRPGTLERAFGAAPGIGFGGLLAGSLLASMAGTVLGSAVAQHFLQSHPDASPLVDGEGAGAGAGDRYADTGDVDSGGDFSGFDGGGDTFDI
jgi:hypothetical protein